MVLYEEKLLQLIEEDERKKGLSLYSFTLTVARSVLAVMDNILVATLNDYGHTLENPFIVDCGTWVGLGARGRARRSFTFTHSSLLTFYFSFLHIQSEFASIVLDFASHFSRSH